MDENDLVRMDMRILYLEDLVSGMNTGLVRALDELERLGKRQERLLGRLKALEEKLGEGPGGG